MENKLWSILICTIEERKLDFEYLLNRLNYQINKENLKNKIEIVSFLDKKGENTIGFKRNSLLNKSKGKYICFIDDDDDISDKYIKSIYDELNANDYDCLSLNGIIYFNSDYPKKFIHSIKYKNYFLQNNIYYRPPNHLNIIKKELVKNFIFPEINIGEDTNWAMQICRSGILKNEKEINEIYYFYNYKK